MGVQCSQCRIKSRHPALPSLMFNQSGAWRYNYVKTAKVKLTSSGLYVFRHLVTELAAMNIKTTARNLAFIDDL